MLLLVTILLVVVGAISLGIGFLQSSLPPIYISIACSILAAAVLLIFSRMTAKSQQVATTGDGPAPLDRGRERADRTQPVPAFSGTGLIGGSSSGETFAPDTDEEPGSRFGGPLADDTDDTDEAHDDDFPIERYDTRRVGEILPLLAELDLDELDLVREREEQGKSRATVLARIDQLIDQLEAEDRHEAAHRFDEVSSPPAADDLDDDLDDEETPVPAPAAEPADPAVPARATSAVSVAALPEDGGYFPIDDYEELRASEILPLLPELDDDELEMVQARERSGAARPSVLSRIEALLSMAGSGEEPTEGAFSAEPAPLAVPETVAVAVVAAEVPSGSRKRAAAKRTPAAPKAAPLAKTPPAKTSPAKKAGRPARAAAPPPPPVVAPVAPVKKAPAKAPSVRKAAPSKAAAPRPTRMAPAAAPAKKAPVRIAAVPAPPAKKRAPAGKVAPVKAAPAAPPRAVKTVKTTTATKKATPPAKVVKAAKVTRKATKS